MDTESKELLREWLVRSLEPVCDADPEVLSKYVLALIQNNPKKEGLPATCISKLEEFLGDETVGFVNRLFKALETGSYKSEDGEEEEVATMGEEGTAPHHPSNPRDREGTRRRSHLSDDEDEHRRNTKRRREDDRLRDPQRNSPRREYGGSRRPAFGPREMRGGRGGPSGAYGGRGERMVHGMDPRRGYGPDWGMPPPMGMWPSPHYPPRGGFRPPMVPEYDPNAYNPDNPAMLPPPQMGMMMPPHMRGQFFPRGPGGRGHRGSVHSVNGGRGYDNTKDMGARGVSGGPDGARTTLRVSNVDPKFVNMTKLSLHFSKFGNVVNVQMRPNFKCAYVQYGTEEEAKKAFHSPIPVCNNRFIEVKWAKYDAKDLYDASSTGEQADSTSKENNGEGGKETTAEATDEDKKAEVEMTQEELRASALEKGRKVLEEKRELLEKQKQLVKQKEELLKRQIAQQKEILERMSQNSANVSLEDKRELLNKITSLSEELKALRSNVPTIPVVGAGPENIQGLKAELTALEAQAAGQHGGRGRGTGGRFPGRGGYFRGRGGRGGRGYTSHHSHTLDNRTTIVKVDKLPDDAQDVSVLEQHFGNFGTIDKVVLDEASPSSGYIKFQDRYGGQSALQHGKVYGDATLDIAWVEPQDAPDALHHSSSPSDVAARGVDVSSTPSATSNPGKVEAAA